MAVPRVLLRLTAIALSCSAASAMERLDVEWKDVTCSVRGGKKGILHGVSGKASAGRLLAVMGPSGSGKTTLLNALAGQIPYSKKTRLHGTLRVGGAERETDQEQAYVKQEDVFYSQLSVRETLLMAARLRLPRSMSLHEKTEMVDELINKLGLSKVADTIVGDEKTRGISGGERKRLSIACQLFGTPSLILCDEPTTGLDSFQAERVMETLRQLAEDGHTVICSIHQPRSSIYGMFDDVLLLSEGRIMYQGPAGRVADYFHSKGHKMPANTNPGDFAVDVVSVDYTSKEAEAESKKRIAGFERHHRASLLSSASSSSTLGSLVSSLISWSSSSSSSPSPPSSSSPLLSVSHGGGGGDSGNAGSAAATKEAIGHERERLRGRSTSGRRGIGWGRRRRRLQDPEEREFRAQHSLVGGAAVTGNKKGVGEKGTLVVSAPSAKDVRVSRARKGAKNGGRAHGAGPLEQFKLLMARSWRQVNRAKFANATRVIANLGSALVFGSIFWKLGLGQTQINDRVGLLQTAVIQTAMSTVAKTLVTFPKEAAIVKAERSLNMYTVLPYVLSKIIAELPLTALFPSVSGVVMYKMTGLHPKRDRLAKFVGIITLEAFTAAAFGMLVGCVAKDGDAALAIGPPLMTIFILFSGFYITQENVPRCLWWLKEASMIKQAFEALCVNELRGLEFECDTRSRGPCIKTGQQMLDRVAFGESTVEGAALGLGKILGACWALTYVALVLGKPRFQPMLPASRLGVETSPVSSPTLAISGGGGGGRRREMSRRAGESESPDEVVAVVQGSLGERNWKLERIPQRSHRLALIRTPPRVPSVPVL
ncbi:unnamed protein product [Scytosiphon promiscuus]